MLTKQEEQRPWGDVSVSQSQIEQLICAAEHALCVQTVQTSPLLDVQVPQVREPVH